MGDSIAQRLQAESPPRSEATSRAVLSRHSPWWGFVFYGVVWALIAVTAIAMPIGAVVELVHPPPRNGDLLQWWLLPAGIALVCTSVPFARWVKRRRSTLTRLARDGTFLDAHVVGVRLSALAVISRSGAAKNAGRVAVIDVPVRGDFVRFGGYVPNTLAGTLAEGTPVRVLATRDCRYVVVITSDGADFLAKGG